MAEKTLNTRIQLKYDTLANWNSSTFKLKAGELAIVTLGEVKDGSTSSAANQHPVLFKVGTGNHTFSELPFASALAADVYAWAKAADVKLTGKTIQFVDGAGEVVKSVELNYITSAEATTLINNALSSYSTTAQMNAAIEVEADRAKAAEAALGERIDAFNLPEGGFASQEDFEALKNKVEDENGALAKANDAYALAETKVATSDFNSFKTNNTTAINTAKSEAIEAAKTETTTQVNALANGAVATNTAAIATINDATNGILAQAKADATSKANAAQSAAEAKVTALADGQVATNKKDISDLSQTVANNKAAADNTQTELTDYKTSNNKALADEIARAKEAEAKALTDAKAYTDQVKAGILGEGISETFDTLVEIQNWINGDGVNATELSSAIAAEAKLRGDEDARLAGLIEANAENIAKFTSGDTKVDKATTADVANSLSNSAKEEVKAVKVNNATNADAATKATQDASGNVITATYETKTDASAKLTEAKGYTDTAKSAVIGASGDASSANTIYGAKKYAEEKASAAQTAATNAAASDATSKANTAEANAKAYADSLAGNYATAAQGTKADSALQKADIATGSANGTISVKGSDVAVKGLGSAAYTASTAYATAAQGTKADSALQSIEAGTGLKVSTKANNKQTIDIDEAVTFIFNCGSASVLID